MMTQSSGSSWLSRQVQVSAWVRCVATGLKTSTKGCEGPCGVDPFQWTVYVLGFMQRPGIGSRSPWVSDSPAPGDDGADYTILR